MKEMIETERKKEEDEERWEYATGGKSMKTITHHCAKNLN